MESLNNDIESINGEFFNLAFSPALSHRFLRMLNVTDIVASRIRQSTEEGRRTAIRCRLPLVVLAESVEELVMRHPHDWPTPRAVLDVPSEIQAFTRFVLDVVWGIARVDLTIPQIQFGLSRHATEDLSRLGARDLITLSQRPSVMLRLRANNQPMIWDRFLIGARCSGPRAVRIAQQTALMSVGIDA